MNEDRYQPVEDAFREDRIQSEDSATLGRYLHALSNQPIHNDLIRHRDIIRGITINHVLLQRHIADLDRKNTNTQRLVLVLTIASVLTGAFQIWYAYRADNRSVIEAERAAAKLPALPEGTISASPAPSNQKAHSSVGTEVTSLQPASAPASVVKPASK